MKMKDLRRYGIPLYPILLWFGWEICHALTSYMAVELEILGKSSLYGVFSVLLYGSVYGFLGYSWFIQLREANYFNLTEGRSYRLDHRETRLDYFTLINDYDPQKVEPNKLRKGNKDIDPGKSWKETTGCILGMSEMGIVRKKSDAAGNLFTSAMPGAGKTTAQIIPTAARFDGSCVVIDIKGDVLSAVKKICKKYGWKRQIRIFAPDDASVSWHYDPFSVTRTMSPVARRLYVEQLGYGLVPDESSENAKFFVDGARTYWCGAALYMLDKDPQVQFIDVVHDILVGNGFEWVTRVISDGCEDSKMYLASLMGSNEKNVAGQYAKLVDSLRPLFNGDLPSILRNTGEKTISAEMLEHRRDLYIEIPQDKIPNYAAITTILVQGLMTHFMERKDNSSGKKPVPCIFLLDEMPQLHFSLEEFLSPALSTLRSKGVSVWMICQSIAQLQKRYGLEGFREIIDNCTYISCMGATDPETCSWFSKLIGDHTVLRRSDNQSMSGTANGNGSTGSQGSSVSRVPEPIYKPQDIANLPNIGADGKVLIRANGKYILADKTFWFK